MAISNRRKAARVKFEQGIDVYLMAIDCTWRRNCIMEDVSETGAKLTVEESIVGFNSRNLFCCYRPPAWRTARCELAWVNGDQIGAKFIAQNKRSSKTSADV